MQLQHIACLTLNEVENKSVFRRKKKLKLEVFGRKLNCKEMEVKAKITFADKKEISTLFSISFESKMLLYFLLGFVLLPRYLANKSFVFYITE